MSRIMDLRSKEVININTGARLGYIYDVEINVVSGALEAIIVPGPARFFGLFGREEDYVIEWNEIKKIGEDIILVDVEISMRPRKKGAGLFR